MNPRRIPLALAIVVGITIFAVFPSAHGSDNKVTPPTMKYLMTFHACQTNKKCEDYRNDLVMLAQSNNGVKFSMVLGWKPFAGSVPTIFRRGNEIFIYTPSKDLHKVNVNTGVVTEVMVTFTSGDGYVDPSIAQLPDGRFVMFYLQGHPGIDPAACSPGEISCVREIRSAVEVKGSDGTKFTPDSTPRISVTLTPSDKAHATFSDPDIFYNGSRWVLYVSRGDSTEVYVSHNLRGSYTGGMAITTHIGGVPAGFKDPVSGKVWTYITASAKNGDQVIRRAVSATGTTPLTNFTTVIDRSISPLLSIKNVESPSMALNSAGTAYRP